MSRENEGATSLIVGVTGHRMLREAELPVLRAQVRDFFGDLRSRYPELPLVLLSSLAEGSDQLAAQVALDMGVRVVAPLPVPVELYRADFDSAQPLAMFERQLAQAEVMTLPLRAGNSLEQIAVRGPQRDQQYAQAGIFISSHCHILLALWDGHDSEFVGGTAQVVRFHLHGEMPGQIERRQAALAQLGLDEETLVYHVPAGRDGDQPMLAAQCCWLSAEQKPDNGPVPAAFDLMFRRQSGFNSDWRKYVAMMPDPGALDAFERSCPIHRLFRAADWLASMHQRRVSHVLRTTYVLAAMMGFAFIVYSENVSHGMIYLFLAFFLAGVGVVGLARRREWHRKYLDYRSLAEGLRVQSYWRRAGIVDINTLFFAHDNFLQKQDVELGWIRNVMRGASLEGILLPTPGDEPEVDRVVEQWIGSPEGGGQLHYYAVTAERREHLHRRAELLGSSCLWMGFGISVLLAFFSGLFEPSVQSGLVAVMGVLSVSAGVHDAYAYKKADKELIKQYRFMLRIFAAALRRLDGCKDVIEKRKVLRTLGEAALAEHAEWTLMHRERPLDHSRL